MTKVEIHLRDDSTGARSNVPDHRFYDVVKIVQDSHYMALVFDNGNKEAFAHDCVERLSITKAETEKESKRRVHQSADTAIETYRDFLDGEADEDDLYDAMRDLDKVVQGES